MLSKNQSKKKFHYAYVVMIGVTLLMIVEALIMGCANIFVAPVSESLGVSVGAVGRHIAYRSAGLCVWGVLVSRFLKKYDTRITLTVTVLITAGCFYVYSIAQNIYVFYACSFFIAFAASILCMQIIPMLTNSWFAVNSAFWLGVGMAMQGLFGTIFQNIGSAIIVAADWRICFRIFALLALLIGLPTSLFIIRKTPQEKGLLPLGYEKAAKNEKAEDTSGYGLAMVEARKTTCFWLSIFIMGLISIGSVFNYYLTAYLKDTGLSTVTAGACSSVLMIGMLVGKILCGKLYSINVHLGMLATLFGIIGFPMLLFANGNVVIICIACFIWGITYAHCTIGGAEIIKYNFGLKDFTAIYGVACSLNGLGGAIGTALWGTTIDTIGYNMTIVFAWCAYVIALTVSIISVKMGDRLRKTAE